MNLPLDFQHGDAAALVFKDGTFSGCRAERLFQHLSDPGGVIAELVRVSRSGACVAVSDADWGSATLDAPNKSVTRRILDCFCDSVSNGWIGRQHPALFKNAGLIDVQVHPQDWIYRRYEDLDRWGFGRTLENAVEMKVISGEEKDELVAHLERADRDDRFFYSATAFVVTGVKP
jgi:hypothetical protein